MTENKKDRKRTEKMGKKIRIALYAASLLILCAIVALLIFSGKKGGTKAEQDTMGNAAESGGTSDDGETEGDSTDADKTITEPDAPGDHTANGDGTEIVSDMEGTKEQDTENLAGTGENGTDPAASADTTLIFTGDVLFANAFKSNYDAGGIGKVIEPKLLEELQNADILMVNEEFPFSNRGTAMADKQFTFRCDPKYVTALTEMGVDIVSLANNHTLDYGREALSDTFQVLDGAGILYAGAGETAERAYELQIIERNGRKFGFLAASRVVPVADWKVEVQAPGMLTAYDDTKLVELIQNAQTECDFLSVMIHWGVEYDEYPQDYQTKIAEDCFAAGADVVIGAHTHCLQGISYIEGKPVFYSLGNFVFGQSINQTMAVKVVVSGQGTVSYELIPAYAQSGTTMKMDTEKAKSLYQYVEKISDGVTIQEDGTLRQE